MLCFQETKRIVERLNKVIANSIDFGKGIVTKNELLRELESLTEIMNIEYRLELNESECPYIEVYRHDEER